MIAMIILVRLSLPSLVISDVEIYLNRSVAGPLKKAMVKSSPIAICMH